jgi:predicted MFS family arabinose efflux permease
MAAGTNSTIAALGMAAATTGLMHTGVVPMLPELPAVLGVSIADAGWVATVALVAGGVATPIVGKVGDVYGARRVVVALLMLGLAGSILAAVATSLPLLLVARALQGPAVAVVPLTFGISRQVFDRQRFPMAVAALTALSLGVGTGLGPLSMGVVVDRWGWRSVFWISVVMSVVSLLMVVWRVPKTPLGPRQDFDVRGAVLLGMILMALLLALSRGAQWGWSSPGVLLLLGASAAGFVAWIRLQQRVPHPLVDLTSLRSRPVGTTHLAGFVIGSTMYAHYVATYALMVQPRQQGYGLGLSVGEASIAQLPAAVVLILAAVMGSGIARRAGSAVLLITGNTLLATGFAALTFWHHQTWHVVATTAAVYAGIGLSYSGLPLMLGRYVPMGETASVNSLNALGRTLGSVVATAAVTAAFASSVRLPGGAPSHLAFRLVFAGCALLAGVTTWLLVVVERRGPRRQMAV